MCCPRGVIHRERGRRSYQETEISELLIVYVLAINFIIRIVLEYGAGARHVDLQISFILAMGLIIQTDMEDGG